MRNPIVIGILEAVQAPIIKAERLPNPWLHAQLGACPFYRRHHFTPERSEFFEAGMAHRRMVYTGQGRLPTDEP